MWNFNNISIRDLPVWIKVQKLETPEMTQENKLDMLSDLVLIDDLLTIQKSQALLRRKRSLKQLIDDRIGLDCNIEINRSNKK